MAILFGAVADDDTGATDLAGMLSDQGARVVLAIDLPSPGQLAAWTDQCDAVVLGVGSRALIPASAYQRMRQGVRLLDALEPALVQIKYCSTFDSTAEGNIGPSIDAALDELAEPFTIALPALPVNGRTTYMGHHFVHRQLLSDSPMRRHPFTPMTNPNLVDHLQSQTRRKVGLAPFPVVRDGAKPLRDYFQRLGESGVNIAIVDCTDDQDLSVICEASRDLKVVTGSSALVIKLPALWRRELAWKPADRGSLLPHPTGKRSGFLVVAGSCSPATRQQNEILVASGAHLTDLDGLCLSEGNADSGAVVATATAELAAGRTCLLRVAACPDDVARVHQWARNNGLSETEAGSRIAIRLAEMVGQIVRESLPEAVIVAGGETSGAVCRTLGLGALRVGVNIEPGVPLCVSLGEVSLPVVLKSGNFGSPDFYHKAINAVMELRH
jgi:uncharacterized protein YgbK (DUF1537 family)